MNKFRSADKNTHNLVKIGEASKLLGVSVDTLRRWEKKGLITPIKTPGGTRLYDTGSLKKIVPGLSTEHESTYFTSQIGSTYSKTPIDDKPKYAVSLPSQMLDDGLSQDIEKVVIQNPSLLKKLGTPILTLVLLGFVSSTLITASKFIKIDQINVKPTEKQITQVRPQLLDKITLPVGEVLAESTPSGTFLEINADTVINGNLTAPNIIYDIIAGDNVTVSEGQTPTISVTGVNEVDTLASVTGRGATTSTLVTLSSGATLGNVLNLGQLSSEPSSAVNGATYYNTTSNKLRCYVNKSWVNCDTDTTGSSFSGIKLAGSSGTNQTISDSDTLTIAAGNGIVTTGTSTDKVTVDLDVTTTSTTTTTSSNSGLEAASDGLRLLGGCSASQALIWDATNAVWTCTSLGSSGISDDSLDFAQFQDTLDLDASTELNFTTFNLTFDLDSTGDFIITDAGVAFVTFADDGSSTFANDIALNGGDLTTTATTATLFNTTATTLSLGGGATTALNIGNGNTAYTAINLGSGTGGNTINIAGTGATGADTINIGTGGTGADTITIGNNASTTSIALTTGTGSQTHTSSVATGTAFSFVSNSVTSGNALTLSSTGTTTGEILDITGTWAPTDGSTNEAIDINITHTPTTSADNFQSINLTTTDGTALGNTVYNLQGTLTLTGNAAKTGIGDYQTVTSSSTTGDTLVSFDAASTVTGIIGGATTRSVYGLRSQPTAGAESTAGTTNVYGLYSNATGDVGVGGTFNAYGAYIANGTYDTDGTSTAYGLYIEDISGADTNIDLNFTGSPIVRIGDVGVLTFTEAGGNNTLCTITDASNLGNLSCTGNITGSTSGTVGFWSRSSTTLSPATANDIVSIANTTTTGADLAITNTGAYTGTGIFNLAANSATTGNIAVLSGTGMTTGEIADITATYAPTDGSTNEAIDINITHTPTTSADNFRSIDLDTSDGTALGNTVYNYDGTLTLTGNAAKTGIGIYQTVTTSSTTADTIYAADLATSATGIIASGTRSNYGLRTQPASTGANTGGIQNMYGVYSAPSATLAAGSTENVYGGYFGGTATVASGTINRYGLYVANATMNTTGTSTQYGLYVESPTGADTNYAAIFAGGNVGIGDTSPSAPLEVGDGTDSIQISSVGDITFVDADGAASITGPAGGALSVVAGASQALTLTGAGASTWSTSNGLLTISGDDGLTLTAASTAGIVGNTVDNITNALDIQEGSNNYINVNTTNSSENLSFGNATTNPSFSFLGTGAVTIAGSADGTDALILTAGDILVSNGDLDLSGGDFNVTLDSGDGVTITGTQPASVGTTPGTAATAIIGISAATGGNTTIGTTGTGGVGSGLAWTLGSGGTAASANTASTGGAGGAYAITSGTGGAAAATGTNLGGAGGAVSLTGGTGGAASGGASNTGGAGGALTLLAGAAGSGGNANGGTLTLNSGAVTGTGTSTLNIGTANTTAFEIGDSTVTKTIDIGGVTSSDASTINIATEGTAADTLTIGNTGSSTSLALSAGTGDITLSTTDDIFNYSTQTSGDILTLGANSAVTVAGSATALRGAFIDLATNYTTADDDTTGLVITLDTASDTDATQDDLLGINISGGTLTASGGSSNPVWTGALVTLPATTNTDSSSTGIILRGFNAITPALTQTQAETITLVGHDLSSAGALIQNTAAGTIAWKGVSLVVPIITQTTGTVTADGVEITIPSSAIVTGGTTQGIDIPTITTGPAAGTLNGINIGNITTPGAGTETTISIGSGWDTDIAFVDSSVILDGPASASITFQDFTTITASSVTALNCSDCIDFDDILDSPTLDASTDINLSTLDLFVDLTSTGVFSIRDVATAYWTFDDDSTVDVLFPAAGTITIDASTTANTTTTGVMFLNVAAGDAAVDAFNLSLTQNDGATAATDATALEILLTGNDADGDMFGITITAASTANSGAGTYEAAIKIDNADTTGSSMTDAIIITSSGVSGGVVDAIDVSAANITNAMNIGLNNILMPNSQINETSGGVTTIEGTGGTDIVSGSANVFNINLGAQIGGTAQRLCHDGADASTSVQAIGDCGATQADLAEWYGVLDDSETGDVVVIGQESIETDYYGGKTTTGYAKKSSSLYEKKLLGVVSTSPSGEILGEAAKPYLPNPKPIALKGRVPVKVSTENGPIEIGDLLTSSSIPGVAMKATNPGETIGKAMQAYNGAQGQIGKVVLFINVSYADPGNVLANMTIGPDGQILAPKITASKLTIPAGINLGGSVTSSGVLVYDTQDITGGDTSYAIDVAASLQTIDSKLADLEAQQASQSAQLAQAQILGEQAVSSVSNLGEKVASTSANLASLTSQIDSLLSSLGGSNQASQSATINDERLTINNLTPPETLIATSSAELTASSLNISNQISTLKLEVSETLKSLGETFLGKTTIAGDLAVDGTFSITEGSKINSLPILYFQTSALAQSVDFFNGLITLDKDGTLTSKSITTQELKLASGKSVGSGKIATGTSFVEIENPLVKPNSRIFITPTSETNLVLIVKDKIEGQKFVVSTQTPTPSDISFDWLIINEVNLSNNLNQPNQTN